MRTGLDDLRVALVHDFLLDLRGAERVFLELCEIWPDADVFTTVYDAAGTEDRFAERTIHTSFLQRLRPTATNFRALLPLYPAAVQSLDLTGYDLVVSSSSAWAHGVRCGPRAIHVCYCHNPFRYAWTEAEVTVAGYPPVVRHGLRAVLARWRRWDRAAARRVDRYVANSALTAGRIRDFYTRDAEVVYPPVRTDRFAAGEVGDHYAIVSELIAHKQIAVAVEAFNRMGRKLTIVGDGPEARSLRRLAGPTITFTGRLSDEGVADILGRCRAFIVCAREEFGIAAVEALAAGRPVIARRTGGLLETIEDGVTGTFWEGGPEGLVAAVLAFDDAGVEPARCQARAERFNVAHFRSEFLAQVTEALADRGLAAAEPRQAVS